MSDTETRVVNETTGGEKGSKLARFDLLPTAPLKAIAEHFGRGAAKYEDRNWERGYDWSLSYAAMQRHLNAWWGGEDLDPELGSSHLAAVAFHVLALLEFEVTHPELDDRAASQATVEVEVTTMGDASPRYINVEVPFDTSAFQSHLDEVRAYIADIAGRTVTGER